MEKDKKVNDEFVRILKGYVHLLTDVERVLFCEWLLQDIHQSLQNDASDQAHIINMWIDDEPKVEMIKYYKQKSNRGIKDINKEITDILDLLNDSLVFMNIRLIQKEIKKRKQ